MMPHDIQVVVPTYNASKEIGLCITALERAGFEGDSIIVVDDGSTDTTREVCLAHNVHLISTKQNNGAAAARNLGVAQTTSEIVLFVDSDVLVAANTRARIAQTFRDPDIAAVFGSYDANPAAPGFVSQYRNLLHRYVHQTGPRHPDTFWTGLGAVRRSPFDIIGGFDLGQRMMEDVKFGLQLSAQNFNIVMDPDLNGQHLKAWTLVSMAKTDLFDRAVPWARLMKIYGLSSQLNLSLRNKLSAAAALCLLLALLALPFFSIAFLGMVVALAAFTMFNLDFLKELAHLRGRRFAVAALFPHLVHTWCAILGFGYVTAFRAKVRHR